MVTLVPYFQMFDQASLKWVFQIYYRLSVANYSFFVSYQLNRVLFSLIVQCSLGQNNCGKLGDNLNLLCHKQGTNVILIDFSHLFVLLRDGTLKKSQKNEIRKPNEELLPSFSFHPVTI